GFDRGVANIQNPPTNATILYYAVNVPGFFLPGGGFSGGGSWLYRGDWNSGAAALSQKRPWGRGLDFGGGPGGTQGMSALSSTANAAISTTFGLNGVNVTFTSLAAGAAGNGTNLNFDFLSGVPGAPPVVTTAANPNPNPAIQDVDIHLNS